MNYSSSSTPGCDRKIEVHIDNERIVTITKTVSKHCEMDTL